MAKKSSNAIAATRAEDDWQVEDAMRTLIRAKQIKSDAKLMAKVKAMANDRLKDMAAVAGSDDD